MRLYRVVAAFLLLFLVVEIVDPSSVFVREAVVRSRTPSGLSRIQHKAPVLAEAELRADRGPAEAGVPADEPSGPDDEDLTVSHVGVVAEFRLVGPRAPGRAAEPPSERWVSAAPLAFYQPPSRA